ncbi:stress response protein NST1-like [Papaver somniferum]|uniref:stress response protein NST1-like n=1 Tax=Papaver somniferum TaxID=3469 RepID=UPI000E6F5F10|nr:stress response protein NST1-like [Papaver somniferum]
MVVTTARDFQVHWLCCGSYGEGAMVLCKLQLVNVAVGVAAAGNAELLRLQEEQAKEALQKVGKRHAGATLGIAYNEKFEENEEPVQQENENESEDEESKNENEEPAQENENESEEGESDNESEEEGESDVEPDLEATNRLLWMKSLKRLMIMETV